MIMPVTEARIFGQQPYSTHVQINPGALATRGLGFEDVRIKFSDRPDKRIGEDAVWDKAEEALMQALEASGRTTVVVAGVATEVAVRLIALAAHRHGL